MKKKLLSFCLGLFAVCLMLGWNVPTAGAAEEEPMTRGSLAQFLMDTLELEYDSSMTIPFTDVSPSDLYYEAVCVCYNKGLLRLYADVNYYDIECTVQRDEFAYALRSTGLPEKYPDTIPADITSNTWSYKLICSVLANNIMSVDENGNFNPSGYAYASGINAAALKQCYVPTTADMVSLDLAKGSIVIKENVKGVTVFQQGENIIRTEDATAIIRQSTVVATENRITVESGHIALTISGLNSCEEEAYDYGYHPRIWINEDAELTLNLVGTNILKSLSSGVKIAENAVLTIQGSGELNVIGDGLGACIEVEGSLVINSGNIIATGSTAGGAGIGAYYVDNCGKIAIHGGIVTANGYTGIGSERCKTVLIDGGTVKASGSSGPGIDTNEILIKNSDVTATSEYSAGICAEGGKVHIENAKVSVTGDKYAIGNRDSYYDNPIANDRACEEITIINSDVTCTTKSKYGYAYHEKITYSSVAPQASLADNSAMFSITASGHSGISYQWQESADNTTWTDLEGQTAATASIPMSAANDGYYYRCKLTNGWGNVVYSDSAQAHILAYTQQPVSVETGLNNAASFNVASSCPNVTYRWERSYDNGQTWNIISGETYPTLIVNATLSESKAKYRCVIMAVNGDELASDMVEINLDTDKPVTYTVQTYLQNTDGSSYTLSDQKIIEGTVGDTVTVPGVSVNGFTENTEKSVPSGVISKDSSLVLKRYFDRNIYEITFAMNGGSSLPPIKALYEAIVKAPTAPARYGYRFIGWYADAEFNKPYAFDTMPLNGAAVYAKWEAIGIGRGTEYQLNGISVRDSNSYELLNAIPTGDFLAEVSMTNLSASSADTLVLAYYNANGQFIDMQYLYANPQIGQTLTFGAYVKNDGSIAKIKAFVMPTLGSPVPLAESMTYPQSQ